MAICAFHVLTTLSLTKLLCRWHYYCYHFTDDETGAQRGQLASLKSHGWERAELGLELSMSGFRVWAARNEGQGPSQERSRAHVKNAWILFSD